jgi:hypothetical protein
MLYLGDQCTWAITGTVTAQTESEAIAEGKQIVAMAWPKVFEALDLKLLPAQAWRVSVRAKP